MGDMFEEFVGGAVAQAVIDMHEELELAMAVSGATLEEDSDLWWAVPADPGDPPMGYPHTKKYLAEETIRALALGDVDGLVKVIIPGRMI